MRLLLFSDIHLNQNFCYNLIDKSQDVDIVVGAGDYCSLRRDLNHVIDWLSEIDKPTILVPGNSESCDELKEACKTWAAATVLHGNSRQLAGLTFYGIGGGIPVTPFGSWSYDFTEKEAEELLSDCPQNAVLVSHSPPKYILDSSSSGGHLGSTSVRKTIEEKSPCLVVCGHIHESGGKIDHYNTSTIVNAGPTGIIHEI